ncbi:hypothetical protein PI125_g72 [Phytophthora idaei]|nr:hypothetical protein PI125_g72 [Phytophthora idaei]KAG3169027.1 hypothetical protein PI126_g3001 [Phytophthora idaei]
MFDGKIGLWPLTETYVAMRGSVNRKKGTICTRNVASGDRPLYKHYIIEEVIPAIKAKWPASERARTIFIQQDNATPHVPGCCCSRHFGRLEYSSPISAAELIRFECAGS